MTVYVKTGGDLWGVIVSDDKDFVYSALEYCILVSKKKWPEERISVRGVDESIVKDIKSNVAKKLQL